MVFHKDGTVVQVGRGHVRKYIHARVFPRADTFVVNMQYYPDGTVMKKNPDSSTIQVATTQSDMHTQPKFISNS